MTQRILITGGAGQIGRELARLDWPDGIEAVFPGRDVLDITSPASIAAMFESTSWACVINCAAWTAVDAAEDRVSATFLANAMGPAWLAESTAAAGVPLVHVSTDYVFSGTLDRPYREDDATLPQSVYGASKLAGEVAVRAANPRSVILRTAWVVSPHRTNFLKTMLRLGAERDEISVVADQQGCPTSAADIAGALQAIALRQMDGTGPVGTYHFVNAGEASWHDLALRIFALGHATGQPSPRVRPISSSEYPSRARRPANSRLGTTLLTRDYGIRPRPWEEAIADILHELLPPASTRGIR